MRSRSSSLEAILEAKPETRKRSAERGEPSRRGRDQEPPDDTGTAQRNRKLPRNIGGTGTAGGTPKAGRKEKGRDLSRDDLIFLLSLLEGELQVPEPKRRFQFYCVRSGDTWWLENDDRALSVFTPLLSRPVMR